MAKMTKEQHAAALKYEEIICEFEIIKYRMGTNGEKGLYPKYKSLSSQETKAKEACKVLGFRPKRVGYETVFVAVKN